MFCKVLEVPVDTLASAEAAFMGGAHRLELCSALAVGGLTPNVGLVCGVVALKQKKYPSCSTGIFVMIRPRVGDFTYSGEEIDSMLDDIMTIKTISGVDGFVFGVLTGTPDCSIDIDACRRLVKACEPKHATFHRAFDYLIASTLVTANDYQPTFKAVDTICGLGFSRILTSGGHLNAFDGWALIKALIDYVKSKQLKIVIMPGSGVSSGNAAEIIKRTECTEIHSSCKGSASASSSSSDVASVKARLLASFGTCTETRQEAVRSICEILSSL